MRVTYPTLENKFHTFQNFVKLREIYRENLHSIVFLFHLCKPVRGTRYKSVTREKDLQNSKFSLTYFVNGLLEEKKKLSHFTKIKILRRKLLIAINGGDLLYTLTTLFFFFSFLTAFISVQRYPFFPRFDLVISTYNLHTSYIAATWRCRSLGKRAYRAARQDEQGGGRGREGADEWWLLKNESESSMSNR